MRSFALILDRWQITIYPGNERSPTTGDGLHVKTVYIQTNYHGDVLVCRQHSHNRDVTMITRRLPNANTDNRVLAPGRFGAQHGRIRLRVHRNTSRCFGKIKVYCVINPFNLL